MLRTVREGLPSSRVTASVTTIDHIVFPLLQIWTQFSPSVNIRLTRPRIRDLGIRVVDLAALLGLILIITASTNGNLPESSLIHVA